MPAVGNPPGRLWPAQPAPVRPPRQCADSSPWDTPDTALRAQGVPGRAEHEKAYLKSELNHYGTSVPAIRSVAGAVAAQHPGLSHDDLVMLVGALWGAPVHERRLAAAGLLTVYRDRLRGEDIVLVERLLRESRTWALAGPLAASVAGRLAERHPEAGVAPGRWARDPGFWIRRAALLALLVPLRRGDGDFGRFARYADALLDDREFFVRKAIGRVLRETARKRPSLVYTWLLPRAGRASAVMVREAIKPLPEQQRMAVLAARRNPGSPATASAGPGWFTATRAACGSPGIRTAARAPPAVA